MKLLCENQLIDEAPLDWSFRLNASRWRLASPGHIWSNSFGSLIAWLQQTVILPHYFVVSHVSLELLLDFLRQGLDLDAQWPKDQVLLMTVHIMHNFVFFEAGARLTLPSGPIPARGSTGCTPCPSESMETDVKLLAGPLSAEIICEVRHGYLHIKWCLLYIYLYILYWLWWYLHKKIYTSIYLSMCKLIKTNEATLHQKQFLLPTTQIETCRVMCPGLSDFASCAAFA